jgi:hypothetical protein
MSYESAPHGKYTLDASPVPTFFYEHKPGDWVCYLFGGTPGGASIMWRPAKGEEPNWFWRWMQFICFGNRWVKK